MKTFDPGAYTLSLLHEPTDRDKQSKIGASNFSSLCTRCVGDDLLNAKPKESSPYWLGATIGTAIHALLEERGLNDPDTLTEQRLTLGIIPGYGEIKSTMDLYHIPSGTVGDYKTTNRDKLKFIKRALLDPPDEFDVTKVVEARFKVMGYINQVMSYGRGMVLAGYDVKRVALIFVCRDGVGDRDVWSWDTEYDPEQASALWDRTLRIWSYLTDGGDVTRLASADSCYYCSQVRDYRGETD